MNSDQSGTTLRNKLRLKTIGHMVVQAGKDMFNDNAFEWSAAVAYYALLSTLPLLLLGAYVASLFVETSFAVHQIVQLLGKFLPTGELEVESLVQEALDQRGTIGLLSGLGLIWTGMRVFGTLTHALNIAYDVDEVYVFWKRWLMQLAMLFSLGVFFLLALALPWVLHFLWDTLAIPSGMQSLVEFAATELAPTLLLVVSLFALYRFVPRRRPSWQAALPGAIFTTALFVASRILFLEYVTRFANYNIIYGSIAIVVILLFWVWIATVLLLFGGEIVSHTQDMLLEGKSADEVNERHVTRSPRQHPEAAS